MTHGLDYAWAHPDPDAMRAAGVQTVFRYVSRDVTKSISAGELAALHARSIAVAPNFEDGTLNATQGAGQGAADAKYANDYLDSLGCPGDVWVWYSCDTAASYDRVVAYYSAIRDSGRRPVAFYGPGPVGQQLKAAGIVQGVWVANAASWSGYSSWDAMASVVRGSDAHVLQHVDHPLPGIPPNFYDYDEILKDFPAWGPSGTSNPPPSPPKRKRRRMFFFKIDGDSVPAAVYIGDGLTYRWLVSPTDLQCQQFVQAQFGNPTNIGHISQAQAAGMVRIGQTPHN